MRARRRPVVKVALVEGQSPSYSEERLEAALDALSEAERFAEAESVVSAAAPKLQRVLNAALEAGGWFGDSHDAETLKAATTPDPDERHHRGAHPARRGGADGDDGWSRRGLGTARRAFERRTRRRV